MAVSDTPKVDIGDGIEIPETVQGYVRYPDLGYEARIEAVYDPQAGRYRGQTLTVEAIEGREVTGEMLRTVRVKDVLRDAITRHMVDELWPLISGRPSPLEPAGGPTTETLQQVALLYRIALLVGDAPAKAVAEALGVPRPTASRWATRARDRGYLTVVDPRGGRVEP